jgi:hypothetical protein
MYTSFYGYILYSHVLHEVVLETWTRGNGRCQKRQTEDQTYMKLGPGTLGALMETHQSSLPPVNSLYTVATQGGEAFLGGAEYGIVILGNRRNLWQLLSECKHLRKNSCTASCPLLLLRLCQFKHAFTGHNYTCSLLQFGAVPNSNTQFILYTCWLPTLYSEFNLLFHLVIHPWTYSYSASSRPTWGFLLLELIS